jgi:hypothetical protein
MIQDGRPWRRALASILVSAAASFLVRGAKPLWPCAWIAFTPVLAFSFAAPAGYASAAAFLAYALGALAFVRLAAGIVPISLVLVFTLIASAVFAIAVLVARRAQQRLPSCSSASSSSWSARSRCSPPKPCCSRRRCHDSYWAASPSFGDYAFWCNGSSTIRAYGVATRSTPRCTSSSPRCGPTSRRSPPWRSPGRAHPSIVSLPLLGTAQVSGYVRLHA